MNLYEFQAKELFEAYGIDVPQGKLVYNPSEALNASKKIGMPVMIKAQVLEGGRGKAGLIRVAEDDSKVLEHAEDLLFPIGRSKNVKKLLVEKKVALRNEYYLGITIDELAALPVLIFGTTGGVDIEQVSQENPDTIFKMSIDPWGRFFEEQTEAFLREIPLNTDTKQKLKSFYERLSRLFFDKECTLAEINPLGLSEEGELVALDAKIIVDDNALFRQTDLHNIEYESSDIPLENEASRRGFFYIKLDGDIGLVTHGAGLSMVTVDMVKNAGGNPANFLDKKGHEREKNKTWDIQIKNEMDIVLSDKRIKTILFSVFAGLVRCDEIAMGLRKYLRENRVGIPIVVRLSGTGSEKVHEILKDENVIVVDNLNEAVSEVVRVSKEE
jgi:succinyl-CoA synthetase beta subunit